ncbi:pyridoxal phosphate-dependent transferase [Leucosporidium creatinivorum]|uniref:Pyridoxal phosphate-dependent transferase n=1 Tax=Leucosporidium creatinivorum TaxID=106004 RepID=A0A1Y2FWM6_9BASI|nr:pyridoxal phosphate-dependent transferase [Leucosporidium creatinivorum]
MSSLAAFGSKTVARGVGRFTDLVLEKGSGAYITTDTGRQMMDFTSGIGVTNLGHCHPKVTKAAQDQCATIVHAQVNIGFNKPQLELMQKLQPLMPHKSLDTFFFWNSGAEAVEASIKLARQATGKQNIIVVQGSYHGRTFGTMAMTKSKTVYGEGFGPLMPGVFTTPYPYWHQVGVPASTSQDELVKQALYQLDLLLKQQTAPRDTAALIIEPVLGEGGYIPAPKGYLEGLRKICDDNGILLIIDEVQTGFGRTGKYFAIEHYPTVRPDIMVIAKGIANGFPLSGIVSRKELMDLQKPGSMGGTYAGNAVSCAAAVAVQEVFEEEKILDNVAARGEELFGLLHELKADKEIGNTIAEVRGLGLMVGIEFNSPTDPYTPSASGAKIPANMASRVQNKCLEQDMLTLTTSVYQCIRFIPPLNITAEEMKKGCDIIRKAITDVVREG